jgi:hypothetical protein
VARKAPYFDDIGLALKYLSPSSNPTNREAQAALARLLAAFAKKLSKGAIHNEQLRQHLAIILANLSQLFDASAPLDANLREFLDIPPPTVKVAKITRLSKGHPNPLNWSIAHEAEELIKAGRPKLKAYRAIAKKYRIGQRRVEQICSDMKRGRFLVRYIMKRDQRSGFMK